MVGGGGSGRSRKLERLFASNERRMFLALLRVEVVRLLRTAEENITRPAVANGASAGRCLQRGYGLVGLAGAGEAVGFLGLVVPGDATTGFSVSLRSLRILLC